MHLVIVWLFYSLMKKNQLILIAVYFFFKKWQVTIDFLAALCGIFLFQHPRPTAEANYSIPGRCLLGKLWWQSVYSIRPSCLFPSPSGLGKTSVYINHLLSTLLSFTWYCRNIWDGKKFVDYHLKKNNMIFGTVRFTFWNT